MKEESVSEQYCGEEQADFWRRKESVSRRLRGRQEGKRWLDLHKQDSSSSKSMRENAGLERVHRGLRFELPSKEPCSTRLNFRSDYSRPVINTWL